MTQVLRLNGNTVEQAWDVLGTYAGAYGDNGGAPDGNEWLPSQEPDDAEEAAAVDAAVEAGLGEMVHVRILDDEDFRVYCGFPNPVGDIEPDNHAGDEAEADLMQMYAESRTAGWAHYGAYGALDEKWIIMPKPQDEWDA